MRVGSKVLIWRSKELACKLTKVQALLICGENEKENKLRLPLLKL